MKKAYKQPELSKVEFQIENIITTSSGTGGGTGNEPVVTPTQTVTLSNDAVVWFDK